MRLAADSAATVSDPGGVCTIYKKDIRPLAIKLSLSIVLAVWILSAAGARVAVFAAVLFTVTIGAKLATESRKAIVLSSSTFEYRLSFGISEVVRIADVSRIEETSTKILVFGKPATVPGVKFVLKTGEDKIFPIDFPARQEILNRLRAMVSPT